MSARSLPKAPSEQAEPTLDLLVAAGRERTILLAGFLAGMGVFFAPLMILGLGLLAAYLADVVSADSVPLFSLGRPLTADDFRGVFAPAVNEAPLLGGAGLLGAAVAQFRRWQARRADPALLAAGVRPYFPEFALVYALLVALAAGAALLHGGWSQLARLVNAAPVFLPFMLCATWLTLVIWGYCFRSVVDLLATRDERAAAVGLRGRVRLHRSAR
jgi:hypothetical protein